MNTPAAQAIRRIRPADLPAPPQSALAILRASSDEHTDLLELAQIAAQDPGLVAALLRMVNSPLYGLGKEVSSAQHAIGLLGTRALRNMVLCLAVRDAIAEHQIAGFDITAWWEASLRRAVSAKGLYQALGEDGDEGFTAGLLQDFGLLALYLIYPPASEGPPLEDLDPDRRFDREQALFGTGHDQVLALLAEAWALPAALREPLCHHHDFQRHPADAPWQPKGRALYCADWVNAVFSCEAPAAAMARTRELLQRLCAIEPERGEAHLKGIPHQVELAAEALGLHVEPQNDLEAVMRRANSRLAAENLSYQELTWKLEKTIAERDRLAGELDAEIAIAQEIQANLLPPAMADDFPVHGANIPARRLSGDFFDFFALKDGRICFCLGDVAGKGINAGLLMAKTSSLFHCLGKHVHDPAQLVRIINDELAENSTRGYFVTLVAGLFDPRTQRVELINAGHLPVIVLGPGAQVRYLEAVAPPLGIAPGTDFSHCKILDLHDRCLYVASDGVTETRHPTGRELGIDGLTLLLNSHAHKPPAQRLHAVLDTLKGDSAIEDDMSLLLICGRGRHG